MIKKDLIKLVSKDTGLSVKDCNTVLNSLSKIIKDRLFFGVDVTIGNFLTFKIHRMKERPGRNPNTGESIIIPPKYKVKVSMPRSFNDKMASKTVH